MSTIDQSYGGDFEQSSKMPVFLKVLCILTFVSCGISLITGLYQFFAGSNVSETVAKLEMSRSGNYMIDGMITGMLKNAAGIDFWTKIQQYLLFGNVALCLSGALLMWKRKKAGYFIYILGQVLPVIGLIGLYGVVKDIPLMGISTILIGIVTEVFAVAFIIMYGLNLKHMR